MKYAAGIAREFERRARSSRNRVGFPVRARHISLPQRIQTGPEANQPRIRWEPGAPTPGIKRQGREVDHSSNLVPRLRLCGATPPVPHMSSCRGALLIKHRENFNVIVKIKVILL
jgi:hypothetical protein